MPRANRIITGQTMVSKVRGIPGTVYVKLISVLVLLVERDRISYRMPGTRSGVPGSRG
jgi:hypothetical protein